MFRPGTALCGVTYALLGIVLAVLLLTIGFWKTLFILALAGIGAVLGGVSQKKDVIRDAVNKRFPSKDTPLAEVEKAKEPEEPTNSQE
ncbi:MAG: DUF2273 domain-containing protein [Clostridia bacterium]|nr:DUF2273 domain-containing protein [Clostridia bacterium]